MSGKAAVLRLKEEACPEYREDLELMVWQLKFLVESLDLMTMQSDFCGEGVFVFCKMAKELLNKMNKELKENG